ncbi:MAG: type II toxin-antitoxin system Phd/YefM family antitoxin [Rectinemataceae bacterium]
MKFMAMRELRNESSKFLQTLEPEEDVVLTNNGKPVAIISHVTEDNFEDTLRSMRRSRALRALGRVQTQSVRAETDRLSDEDIAAEIEAVRKARPR